MGLEGRLDSGFRLHIKVVKELMTLPRPCLGILRHRPIYRELARTYSHAIESGLLCL